MPSKPDHAATPAEVKAYGVVVHCHERNHSFFIAGFHQDPINAQLRCGLDTVGLNVRNILRIPAYVSVTLYRIQQPAIRTAAKE